MTKVVNDWSVYKTGHNLFVILFNNPDLSNYMTLMLFVLPNTIFLPLFIKKNLSLNFKVAGLENKKPVTGMATMN